MPNSIEISAWLYEPQYDALDWALKQIGAGSIEQELQRLLDARYKELVPEEQQKLIENDLREQLEAEKIERENARRYSAVRITEGGRSRYFEADAFPDMRSVAIYLRRYLKDELSVKKDTLADFYESRGGREIDAPAFRQRREAFGSSPNVTGVFEIDLDAGIFTARDQENGQPTAYSVKDVSTAAYHAMRSTGIPLAKEYIFEGKLKGKELSTVPEPEQPEEPKLSI